MSRKDDIDFLAHSLKDPFLNFSVLFYSLGLLLCMTYLKLGILNLKESNKKFNHKGVLTLRLCHLIFIPRICAVVMFVGCHQP